MECKPANRRLDKSCNVSCELIHRQSQSLFCVTFFVACKSLFDSWILFYHPILHYNHFNITDEKLVKLIEIYKVFVASSVVANVRFFFEWQFKSANRIMQCFELLFFYLFHSINGKISEFKSDLDRIHFYFYLSLKSPWLISYLCEKIFHLQWNE